MRQCRQLAIIMGIAAGVVFVRQWLFVHDPLWMALTVCIVGPTVVYGFVVGLLYLDTRVDRRIELRDERSARGSGRSAEEAQR